MELVATVRDTCNYVYDLERSADRGVDATMITSERCLTRDIRGRITQVRKIEVCMDDALQKTISCSSWQEINAATNRVSQELSHEIAFRLNEVFTSYLFTSGLEGAFEHMNNRTLETIFAEFDKRAAAQPIEAGELNGVKYALYESPDEETQLEKTASCVSTTPWLARQLIRALSWLTKGR